MAKKRPLVIVTRKLPEVIETRMMELFDTRLNNNDAPMSQADLIDAAKTADVLVPTVTDRIDKGILAQANPELRLIANFGTGVDNIDLATARQRGITVTSTPGVLTEDTADMTMALILAVPRRLAEGERLVRSGEWRGWGPTTMLGHRIWGKRLGIIGMGRIGTAVARRARGFGLSIHYHNRHRVHGDLESELEATYWESLDQMVARMDIISVNCPHTPATFHLLSARQLKLVQPHAYIVNTARGEVIDENALTRMLRAGDIAGAGLDVFEHEPAVNPKLIELDNVVLLPHTLELIPSPHALLREVDRVLRANGYLVVLSFRPNGVWGLRHLLSRGGYPPGHQRLIREGRLRGWLELLSFEIGPRQGYCHTLPFERSRKFGMLPEGSEVVPWFPGFSEGYLLCAQKQVHPLTPIRRPWRQRHLKVVGGLVEPTTHVSQRRQCG